MPLTQKPAEFVVALGDSYSSGEGTSAFDGSTFFRGSDHHGSETYFQNACHRSPEAWPYKVDAPNISGVATTGELAAAGDPRIDFQMLACAGAETENLLPSSEYTRYKQQFGEATQLDRGFLDGNTTLVTLTIGGNDVGFGPVLQGCISSVASHPNEPCVNLSAGSEFDGTWGQMVDSRLASLGGHVQEVLSEIHEDAPNARIIMQGYPKLFEDGGNCVLMSAVNVPWLNSVSERLNRVLTQAAFSAGSYVTYENPWYEFSGRNLCGEPNALTRLILQTTPGDKVVYLTNPNTSESFGISAQSMHPNPTGSVAYASTARDALTSTRTDLSGTVVGGAPVVYYSTLRWMEGPTSMSVSSFSTCGGELRIGLRTGVAGTQDTESLAWLVPHDMLTFKLTNPLPNNSPYSLPGNSYAMNARLTTACQGGGTQTWAGDIYR